MGIFKSKEERRIARDMEIKKGIQRIRRWRCPGLASCPMEGCDHFGLAVASARRASELARYWVPARMLAARALVASGDDEAGLAAARDLVMEPDSDVATHLEYGRVSFANQPQWYGRDRSYVMRDVFTRGAIAARRRTHQHTVFIETTDSRTIELRFCCVFEIVSPVFELELVRDAFVELTQLFLGEYVVQ